MPYRKTNGRLPKGRWAVPAGMLLASVSFTPGHAVDNVIRETRHFFECFGMMIGDPDAHARNCLPNRVVLNGPIHQTTGGDFVPPPPPAPPMVEPPPPPPPPPVIEPPAPPIAPDPCACGSCYAT